MSRFVINPLPIQGLKLVERHRLGDSRGFLSRIFCADELAKAGWQKPIAQINHTYTAKRGTVRGLHYQHFPHTEMKLVNCLRGEVWDVAIDLRSDSHTFLQWYAERLSADNGRALLIPEGFAHGFQSLTDDCELLYLHTTAHSPRAEAGLRFDEPEIGITWPMPPTEISDRDMTHPWVNSDFRGVSL